jgi:general secretion pathway protein E
MNSIVSRIKIESALNIAEKRLPQDGRITKKIAGKSFDIRVSTIPTSRGYERIVMRLLNKSSVLLDLPDLGFSPREYALMDGLIRRPDGIILVTGPTGSGKTTTLYAALDLLNDAERVLMTIEDPVEYRIPGVNQIEVHPRTGLTFARGLRTMLRSDPDVLLVGEIRDEETARIAIQAAMTGHLVLTTLHTHNAASSIARLKDMGVEPGLLATSINCIVAQRLARRLCLECRQEYEALPGELEELGFELGEKSDAPITLYRPNGCVQCHGTGYAGRVALYEVMPIQGRIRRLIEASTEEIFAAAVEQGMQTLRQDGVRLCLEGVSSVEEIRRVTGDRLV